MHACLQFLDTVVAYSSLPHDSLPQFIGALCRTVNEAAYCQISWKVNASFTKTTPFFFRYFKPTDYEKPFGNTHGPFDFVHDVSHSAGAELSREQYFVARCGVFHQDGAVGRATSHKFALPA